jgi:hypothetical protein
MEGKVYNLIRFSKDERYERDKVNEGKGEA